MSRVRNTCIKFRKSRSNNTKCCFKNIVQITHVRFKLLQHMVSQATLYIICFPRIVLVTYVNVDIHSICLIMTLSCLKSLLLCALYTNLSHLITNLFLYVLFCVFPVCYDVRLSHLNKDYLLTYLLMVQIWCGWVCYHDNSKLHASILTKLGL